MSMIFLSEANWQRSVTIQRSLTDRELLRTSIMSHNAQTGVCQQLQELSGVNSNMDVPDGIFLRELPQKFESHCGVKLDPKTFVS